MSFSQSNDLPAGYSFRLANQEDSIKIFCFELIDKYYLTDRINEILFVYALLTMLWIAAMIYTLSAWTFSFVFYPLSVVCTLVFLDHLKYINDIKSGVFSVWLVEHRNKVCGYMVCKNSIEHTLLHRLLVIKTDRRQGIGRFLITHCIDTVRKPIYVIAPPELSNFYYLHGFVDVDYSNIPNELSKLQDHNGIQIMVFQNGQFPADRF
jgi:N-acetylglutamate synthase-like GNAT family acetyltransferase